MPDGGIHLLLAEVDVVVCWSREMVVGRAAGDGGASRDVELSLAGLFNPLPIAVVSFLLVEGVAEGMAEKVLYFYIFVCNFEDQCIT